MNRKNICIITGSRAEYGLLKPLIQKLSKDNDLNLKIIATGMHLSPEFDLTYKEIEKDGYKIDEKVEMLLSSDTPIGVSKSIGLGMISFADIYQRLKLDMIVVLGDRYEIFAAVSTASVARIPVIHLHGGETTEGAFDEGFRHSITKMSYLHFTSTEEYRKRVIQLGESPDRVFNVGAIGIENINNMKLLSKKELEESMGFKFGEKTALATFHPVTLENTTSKQQFENLLKAIDEFDELKVIFTKSNSDTDGRMINKMIDDYVDQNKHKAVAFVSMGQLRYLSAMKYVDVVIGNSSSGIIEAPTLKIPTLNIGDRQKGRIQAKSVINCTPVKRDLVKAINKVLYSDFKESLKHVQNPYGDGDVSYKIIKVIKKFLFDGTMDIKKKFYDIL